MKGKKVLALLTCTALLAGGLTACGNSSSTAPAPSTENTAETAAPEAETTKPPLSKHPQPLTMPPLRKISQAP